MLSNNSKFNLLGIFLLSFAVLVFELALIRLFSVILFPSIAFFGITITMFGITAGGLIAYTYPGFGERPGGFQKLSLGFALTASLFIFVFVSADVRLALLFFIFATIPFIFANICLSMVLMTNASSAGRWYAADLLGAGIGVVMAVVFMNILSTPQVVIISVISSLLASAVFAETKKAFLFSLSISALAGFLLFLPKSSELLTVNYSKGVSETHKIFEQWNSFSRITLSEESNFQHGISMPLSYYQKPIQWKQLGIRIDGDAYTPVINFDGDFKKVSDLKKDITGAVFAARPPGRALIIGVGGGKDALIAVINGWSVRGIEINDIIANDIMKGIMKDFSGGIYERDGVEVVVAEGRSFIKGDSGVYDAIDLSLVDTWASTVTGNLALVEGYLYTVEAFEDYLSHLSEDGILTISRWSFDGDRLVTLFGEASRHLGLKKTENNLVVISRPDNYGRPWLNNYLFKRTTYSDEEIKKLEKFAKTGEFTILYNPKKPANNFYQTLLKENGWKNFGSSHSANLSLATDDKPFFFFNNQFSSFFKSKSYIHSTPDGGLGLTLKTAIIFVFLTILIPLIKQGQKVVFRPSAMRHLSYFALLGASFMFIEIGLIQKFVLYLEYPIYSYSVVLTVILIASGLGSFISANFSSDSSRMFYILGGVVFLFSVFFMFFGKIAIDTTIAMALWQKVLLAGLVTSVPSLAMGFFMPLGIRKLNNAGLINLVPWAWAINGAVSILASVTSVILAIGFGFSFLILTGGIGYLLAVWSVVPSNRK